MAFTAKDVQALRERTGVGMMDCKKALVECDGDMDKAVDFLREKGLASAAKKAGRIAAQGVIGVYNDANSSALVELNCETDFVGNNPDFKALANQIAKTVVAVKPADVDALNAAKIADGDTTVAEAIQELFLKIRENMKLRRFVLVEGTAVSYIHGGGSVGVLVSFDTDAADKAEFIEMGRNVAMQVAAMRPEYLKKDDISADELAKLRSITVDSALNKPDSLPVPILKSLIEKACADKRWSDEDIAIYEEKKSNMKFLFNFLSKEAYASLAELAVESKNDIVDNKIFVGMVEGRVSKQLKEICLLEQTFVRADLFEGTVGGYIANVAKTMGAKIDITGFTRYEKGEGIEKKEDNFADEVASMIG
ncbi:MAG: translation elongation factor Ts [Clostridiales bacterium]|nr:translation elongation factor Ts [Clostridiales bacterium]